ncbi:MAG: tetratricopeptide repeat protein [Deltaproteobacteria bacterium]|nr:tetratricopeptide repeat protein [Deltaproteobacteria bacterium]
MKDGNLKEMTDLIWEAEYYLNQGSYHLAIDLAQERLEMYPGDVEARVILGYAWFKLGELDRALNILRGLEEDFQRWSYVFRYMGDIYQKKGLLAEARKSYQLFRTLNPEESLALELSEGVAPGRDAAALRRKEDGASPEETDISRVSPEFRTLTLADLCIEQGHFDQARNILEEILSKDPGNEKVRQKLGSLKNLLSAKIESRHPEENREEVVRELNRWLKNLERTRDHGA